MKIKRTLTLILILLITAAGLIVTKKIQADNSSMTYREKAQVSDNFVESIGINTKFGFCPGRLCDNYPEVKALLAELGIRYIRDIPYPEPWRIRTDLYEDFGIRMLVGVERSRKKPLDLETILQQLDVIKSWGKMIVGISGVNEDDLSKAHSCEETENCDRNWSEKTWSSNYLKFQQRLYNLVKADPELDRLPVVLGPMAKLDSLKELDDLGAVCDRGNDHSYPGTLGKPSQESGGGTKDSLRSIDKVVAEVQRVCPDRKLWITETGYAEAPDRDRSNTRLVTREAKAKYLPRIYANYYLQGQIEKTFLFELLSANQTRSTEYGIIDPDIQPTPAYYSIKNMISLLEEATWNKSTQSWQYPDFKPSYLKYSLKGNTTDIKHLLLQKSDRTFYLLIWQEVYVYDNQTKKDLVNRDRTINFKLDGATIEKANKYLLYNDDPAAKLAPLKTWTDVTNLTLNVPDHILVLEFTLED